MITTKKIFLLLLFLLMLSIVYGQENAAKEKRPFYFELNVDEDLFLLKSTDQFYSFGTAILFGWKGLDNKFTNTILPKLSDSHQLFKMGIVHKMYTPRDVQRADVDSTDIPFCGETYLTLIHNSLNPSLGLVLMTKLDLGVVGEISGARHFQNSFHSAIGNNEIAGWENQIGNGLYLNYTAVLMHNLISSFSFAEAFVGGRGTVGTMDISFEGFVYLRVGIFNDFFVQAERPYSKKADLSSFYNLADKSYARMKYPDTMWSEDPALREKATSTWLSRNFKPLQVYIKFISGGILNAYDGQMQGSLIAFESSPYTIPADKIPMWQHRLSVGIVFSYKFGTLEYNWDRITYEPDDKFPPYYPKWGRFNLNFNL
ncbi:lipid A deacylase LpxR family protein [Flammeovirga aprica JL-4]|uniref:Lipid A deacylase LpxR family protein n=1 Tax=Flammeovirga aprica JL-4 TaxID=694437 RepID=A0A7X9RVJ6_9BACT|nr:lipid A deacylase LpxR family protein [Flammeovirga aprica JL-4]